MKTKTAVKPEPTPIPWKIITKHDLPEIVDTEDNQRIAVMKGQGMRPNTVNAAFIVRAVNNFQKLLNSFKEAHAHMTSDGRKAGCEYCEVIREAEGR